MYDITYTRALRAIVVARATFAIARGRTRHNRWRDRNRKEKKILNLST